MWSGGGYHDRDVREGFAPLMYSPKILIGNGFHTHIGKDYLQKIVEQFDLEWDWTIDRW